MSVADATSVDSEYKRRLGIREAAVARLAKVHDRIGSGRLALGVAVLLVGWGALFERAFHPLWLLVPVGAFVALLFYHSSVRRARVAADRAATYYKHGIARIEDRWTGLGQPGERFTQMAHIYSADLDLFGKGSLFELLSVARTRMGEDTLAKWLSEPASIETVRDRQESVVDLRERLDLREEMAVLGEDARVGVNPESLLSWAEAPNELPAGWLFGVAVALPLLALAAALFWHYKDFATPFVLVVLIEVGVMSLVKKAMDRALGSTEQAFHDVKLFAELLIRIERNTFSAPGLVRLVQRLSSHTQSASATIGRLARVVDFADARANPLLRILDVPLMYSVHVALAAERWRRDHGKVIREWVAAMGEFEALSSLAGYSYEHPADPFPVLVDGPAQFVASELGHPLIPAVRCVRNSVSIQEPTRVLLISGSNMSGKSTLLRTVGINTVLAMAGAPVRARSLQLTPLQIGASIRVNDSLHEGSSRFYAEITRLREIYGLLEGRLPVLFLLDEVLQGTNSKDRLAGAQGIVRAFVEAGAIGLVSTHDLALTDISGLALRNVHFQDELVDGKMRFDFTLREGIVTKSNGIELMRAVGLKV
jgi:hypothetical protein